MAVVFAACVCILAIGFVWFYVVRPILEDYGVIVSPSQNSAPSTARVMSTSKAMIEQTDKTDKQTDTVFADDPWIERLKVDRTKTALIELLVYSEWGVGEIRSILKGDTGALGVEIEAARKRIGIAAEPPRMLKVRDNGRDERVIPMDADYPYRALET